jgi:hypothetical protein
MLGTYIRRSPNRTVCATERFLFWSLDVNSKLDVPSASIVLQQHEQQTRKQKAAVQRMSLDAVCRKSAHWPCRAHQSWVRDDRHDSRQCT